LKLHDPRHTFASAAVAAGQGLPMIGKLLGHMQVQTTDATRIWRLDPVKAAAAHVSAAIARSILGEGHEKAAANE
jgi:integrase